MDRAAGDNDCLRADGDAMDSSGRPHPGRRPPFDHDAPHMAIDDNASATLCSVLEVGDECRLLGAAATTEAAVAAGVILRAATHVTRQEPVVPLQLLETANQHAIASRGARVRGVDGDTLRYGVE